MENIQPWSNMEKMCINVKKNKINAYTRKETEKAYRK